jgi:phage tail protein X
MNEYIVKSGDMLDEICYKHYGSTYEGQVESVLEANRDLDLGQYITLPIGLIIKLPIISFKTNEAVKLFS